MDSRTGGLDERPPVESMGEVLLEGLEDEVPQKLHGGQNHRPVKCNIPVPVNGSNGQSRLCESFGKYRVIK